ncbi:DUF2997 domain-containing protein [candidate division KSB3 bacterium]|uniref:DUF2997 domain-containing protein n=1 Tax=candidate division KSB3 bacterium TaxID=2044937 RepID=A0A9D5JTL3_9BACT|nr:DUF2997 domain-containing protein [candidate division KSB3 bacterium]MBD3323869.1 DUF2997 domain-containing protein [candidate division KSB3 bacterium]
MMATKQEVEFTITPDGNVEFIIRGAKGKQCLPIADLFKVLGTTEAEHATGEFYEKEDDRNVLISGSE